MTKLKGTIERRGSADYHKIPDPAINGDIVEIKKESNSSVNEAN